MMKPFDYSRDFTQINFREHPARIFYAYYVKAKEDALYSRQSSISTPSASSPAVSSGHVRLCQN